MIVNLCELSVNKCEYKNYSNSTVQLQMAAHLYCIRVEFHCLLMNEQHVNCLNEDLIESSIMLKAIVI